MCGIIGYAGKESAAGVLLEGLSNLEYRGYDSAGISVFENGVIETVKTKGRLQELRDKVAAHKPLLGGCGIGHTRWATHGEPSERNSHPHATQKLSLVHNGIIENYLQLKQGLQAHGCAFASETDTEVAARLIDFLYEGDPFAAICKALEKLEGSFALGVIFADHPGKIFAVRKDSPLIVGLGDAENYIASDVPAILSRTRDYYLLDELEIAEIVRDEVTVRDTQGKVVGKKRLTADWSVDAAQRGGYDHFMLKEIHEQPHVLLDTVRARVGNGLPDFSDDGLPEGFFGRFRRIHVVACGTAMYAGTVGRALIERLARIPVLTDLASEFRYRNPILFPDDLFIAISQSGETADTLAALRLAKNAGVTTLSVVNVIGSSIAREADYVVHTFAGPEIAVASTKAFSVQIATTCLFAIAMALQNGRLDTAEARRLTAGLLDAVARTKDAIAFAGTLEDMAEHFVDTSSLFYLGRGVDHALAMEGSLKLKEISYIHSESYAAGELKHGTISLITDGVPVVALITQRDLLPKVVSNVKEVRSRGGYVFVITMEGFDIDEDIYDDIVHLPAVNDLFAPILSVIILQLFAYYVAVARGCDVDKPRNLAKSVTVE